MIKCNCGKKLELPATYIRNTPEGIPVIQYKCICGHVYETLLDTLPSYISKRSGNANISRGEYFQYKKPKIKFACPLCERNQFIKDPKLMTNEEESFIFTNVTCENGCGFKANIILEDWKKK